MGVKVKKVTLLLLLAATIGIVVIFQIQKPILSEYNAMIKAKEYVDIVNEKLNSKFDTEINAKYVVLEKNTFWNKLLGNQQWSSMIDGVIVNIDAHSGEFVQMVFPLDGVISKLPE
ncbi:hypothetical protein BK120_06965 [Paenibacillus sp. FSL A5-0031]|uniref:hypothetical protein n=1 Tax=Paenibacillus sp. FSL A5-0031 TaxID=1920420 RepID=UPI00096EFD5B|nr:hypothetical protein [Paenibacillus sp. FSL A5-0031]OME86675.1 hypothetical protein BK120_06965 [Paenibacillus sp. FSL A5-0031]